MNQQGLRRFALGALLPVTLAGTVGCTTAPGGAQAAAAAPPSGLVQISRTANGVAHIVAADPEMLAYGVAYAHAQDNVCQTAEALVTTRAERAQHFGAKAIGQLGLRALPNDQIDLFIKAFVDDEAVGRAAAQSSAEANAMARGYVAGYNRHLADHAGQLPAACAGKPGSSQ
jgi:acyl-homoserine-lactone acylase